MNSTRRGFLAGVGALFAAPSIVRADSLMPVRAWRFIPARKYPVAIVARQLRLSAGLSGEDAFDPAHAEKLFGDHYLGATARDDYQRLVWRDDTILPPPEIQVDGDAYAPPGVFNFAQLRKHEGWKKEVRKPQSSVKRLTLEQIKRWNELRAHTGMRMEIVT